MNVNIFDGIILNEKEEVALKTGQAKAWGGILSYHWAQIPKMKNNVEEQNKWCSETFGSSGHRWFEKEGRYYFKDEKDLTIFVLKYS